MRSNRVCAVRSRPGSETSNEAATVGPAGSGSTAILTWSMDVLPQAPQLADTTPVRANTSSPRGKVVATVTTL